MRPLTILLCCGFLSFLSANPLYSQTRFGVKGGLSLTNGVFDLMETNYALRAHAGVLAKIPLIGKFYVQPELLYSMKGWKSPEFDVATGLDYLNMPILIGFNLNESFSVFAGPELGLKVAGRLNPSSPLWEDYYEKKDIGLAAGVQYLAGSRIGIDLRYVYGFEGLEKIDWRDANNNRIAIIKSGSNRAIQLGVFYYLNK